MSATATDAGGERFQHDVFISYAREDTDWVMTNLYEPLVRCRMSDGARARIFLDVSPEGLEPGVDFTNSLAGAITAARVFVPVYSSTYFSKKWCLWELTMAFTEDPTGMDGRLSPVAIDPEAEKLVPPKMRAINYIVSWRQDWFSIVCRRLGLEPEESPVRLEFVDQPADTYVNHTLAPIRVRASAGEDQVGRSLAAEEDVTLSATSGTLAGTVTVSTKDGVATFDDLSIQTVEDRTTLVAEAPGCSPAETAAFAVRNEPASAGSGGHTIQAPGAHRVVFLAGGDSMAVITADRAAVYDLAGEELGAVRLEGPLRLVRPAETGVGLAGWAGDAHVLQVDGSRRSWRAVRAEDGRVTLSPNPAPTGGEAEASRPVVVPGDLLMLDDGVYVGFWNGAIYKLGGDEPHGLHHKGGVQALAMAGELLCVADLAGTLHFFGDGERGAPLELEPAIHLLKSYPGYLVAAGDRSIYQIIPETGEIFTDQHHLGEPVASYVGTDVPVMIDGDGRGIGFDRDLVIRFRFHTVPGAVPTSADRDGRHHAFTNPDGSGSLLRDGRVVLTNPAGPVAVSSAGDRLALGDPEGIKILSMDEIDRRMAS